MNELEYLTNDEFTYLLPLCVDEYTTRNIVESIKEYRRTGENCYEDTILSVLMKMENSIQKRLMKYVQKSSLLQKML